MKSRLILLLTALICLSGLIAPRQAVEPGRKVLLVVASRHYLESEYQNTRHALEAAGFTVEAASDAATATEIRADLLTGQANAADYAAIAVIGGTGAKDLLWEHTGLRSLLQAAHA